RGGPEEDCRNPTPSLNETARTTEDQPRTFRFGENITRSRRVRSRVRRATAPARDTKRNSRPALDRYSRRQSPRRADGLCRCKRRQTRISRKIIAGGPAGGKKPRSTARRLINVFLLRVYGFVIRVFTLLEVTPGEKSVVVLVPSLGKEKRGKKGS